MARIYTIEVLDIDLNGQTIETTGSEHNDTLGTADIIVFELIATNVDNGGAANPTITITVEHSNDGRNWTQHTTKTTVAIATSKHVYMEQTTDGKALGSQVRLTVGLSTDEASGRIKLSVSGRSY